MYSPFTDSAPSGNQTEYKKHPFHKQIREPPKRGDILHGPAKRQSGTSPSEAAVTEDCNQWFEVLFFCEDFQAAIYVNELN